ncbi:hypothetical protein QFZ70_001480 [Arthrobacter sp. V1I9]|uniref:hypothetical protein n=1 Tax=Arthrobacter sp. V1I9 TaxID=3042275 RepID=UPI00278E2D82|nr:hypothetical protein [Arthrobacter sp. V1I9]MDQ0869007.1 hypothetical protein [Arthrobacter sp. V1I9]
MVQRRISGAVGKAKKKGSHLKSFAQRRAEALLKQRRTAEKENDQPAANETDKNLRRFRSRFGRAVLNAETGRWEIRRDSEVVAIQQAVGFARKPETPMPDMDISLFLDTDDAVSALRVIKATQRIASELGYQTPRIVEVERGSFIARFLAAWNGAKGQKVRAESLAKAKEFALEAEQYGRLHVQDKQADVDQKNVSSAVELINATADIPSVALKAGALLFLKYTGPDGQPVIVSRTLSTREMAIYDKTPSLKADPSKVEENLAILVALDEAQDDDQPRAIGQ